MEDPVQTASILILVFTVGLGLFGTQLVFEILEHLSKSFSIIDIIINFGKNQIYRHSSAQLKSKAIW